LWQEAEKNKYDRNMLSLKIGDTGALFDSRVKEIRFYNYKILPESIDLTGKSKYHNNQERNDE
jgi:hypothetical protein